eukprot:TRINITY_DN1626_c0_g1_i5.p1 TRINITY_DN1626_c0_g1~~TRINITY_DN1626_c0_g1_i5.p1  ORF type:complete len:746 (+),score=88.01 TRINITY_DN1626_c0_g1_i5:85-2322(+)
MKSSTSVQALALPLVWALLVASLGSAHAEQQHQYCIVGAGPAGIQLGHFLLHAKRDYVIFERGARAGTFFEHYPRQRKLISLNKRKVRENRSDEFAFRHDWNTLIDVRPEQERAKPVTERSAELFPHADVLTEYLRDFAEEQVQHIRYNSDVKKISKKQDSKGYTVNVNQESFSCEDVIIASGLSKPRTDVRAIMFDGVEHVTGYEAMPETGESFEGKAVHVFGIGNAAMETVQELNKYTAEVHQQSRQRDLPGGGKGVRFAYETHYVGDIRAGRTGILDTYLLKSLDTFNFDGLDQQAPGSRHLVLPCLGRLCIWSVSCDEDDEQCVEQAEQGVQGLNYRIPALSWPVGSKRGTRILQKLKEAGLSKYRRDYTISRDQWSEDPVYQKKLKKHHPGYSARYEADKAIIDKRNKLKHDIDNSVFEIEKEHLTMSTKHLRENQELLDFIATERQTEEHETFAFPTDSLIICFGWIMDRSIFDDALAAEVAMTHNDKYPALTSMFEVKTKQNKTMPGLYVAGTLSHGLDFRKSAGGFIHGFRYTARALFKHLEEKNHGIAWPSDKIELKAQMKQCSTADGDTAGSCKFGISHTSGLMERLLGRINEASGPYQMFEALGDMVVFNQSTSTQTWNATYLEEVPLEYFHDRYRASPRLTWVFRYADDFHGPKVLGPERVGATEFSQAHMSNFLHPRISFYPANSVNATKEHYLLEDIFTQWTSLEDKIPLNRFLDKVLDALNGKESEEMKE